MNRCSNAWRPLLLAVALLSVLVGVAGAVPTDRTNALSTPRQLVIAASDFHPCDDSYDYSDYGDVIYLGGSTSFGYFVAPVDFPVPYYATIDKFELFAYDNNATGNVTAALYLSKPSSWTQQQIASLDTGWDHASATHDTWQTTAISPNVKNPANDVYVYVYISDPSNLTVRGVRIWYRAGK